MHSSKSLQAALAAARALVASLEAALEQAEQPTDDRALGLDAAGEASGISPHTLRTWCKSGRLRSHRGARGAYLVRRSDIDEAIAAGSAAPATRTRATVVDLVQWDREAEADLRSLGGPTSRG